MTAGSRWRARVKTPTGEVLSVKAGGNPPPKEIKAAREAVELTQTAAASIVYCTLNTWQKWEAGHTKMHPAFWELFLIKTQAVKRRKIS